ncbi:histidine phosphatase family protein [Microbacterium sp. STN6]|uniref:histidine phosphatase family protein n=1 Tax=Microbacterium sp. STN6 TaxID=2995588 RepID=UPI002260AD01|nr:histidine phosphatase family protein [Microbacterium sp. STN6]MCX7521594.1 histidine phosphatase family protein [Microbacterium sp. STN6]
MTRLALVRHGQTDWNLARRIQGTSDIPLNETGRAQARAAGLLLARRRWDSVWASPLSRAFETAGIIAAENGLGEPGVLEGVAERAYGKAEGLTSDEILERFPEGAVIEGQETRAEVVERALPALVELAEAHPGESLVVVSHGGVIGSLVRHVTEHALPGPGQLIANGSVHDFLYEHGVMRLDRFNQSPDDHDLITAAVQ